MSGHTIVAEKHVEIKPLADILRWAINLDDGTYIVQEEDGTIDAERAETREKFESYFETSGSRSFLIVPLKDDEGKIGVFALESGETYGFSERDLEAAGLLGVQAASAIRNARLDARVPMAAARPSA